MMQAVRVPAHLVPPGSPQAKQLCHLHTQPPLGQSCHRPKKKKILCLCAQGGLRLWWSLTLCNPVDVACQASVPERGFSRQEYWSILANTGCRTLLEHCISCSCQPLWVPGATEPLWPKQLHHLLHWGRPSSPGLPQEQTLVDNPHAEVEINPHLKLRGSVAKEEDPKPLHQLYNLQIKFTWSIRHSVFMEYIKVYWELWQKKAH